MWSFSFGGKYDIKEAGTYCKNDNNVNINLLYMYTCFSFPD